MSVAPTGPWWAKGLLFENCSCQLVCPGHMHFSQLCTYDRCIGYWAMRFDEGEHQGTSLAGARAVVIYDCPQHMIEGGWIQRFLVDAGDEQAERLETILSGRAGGPWGVLARFVGERLPTRRVGNRIDDEERTKRVVIDGLLEAAVESIKGRDRSLPVTFDNLFNQIHAPKQMLGRGTSRYRDERLSVDNEGTHGLWSRFDWSVAR